MAGEGEAEEPSQPNYEGCICVIDQSAVVLPEIISNSLGEGSGVSPQHIVSRCVIGVVEENVDIESPHSAIKGGGDGDEVIVSGDDCDVDDYLGAGSGVDKEAS